MFLTLLTVVQPITDPQTVAKIAETAAESSGWTPGAVNMVLGTLVVLVGSITTLATLVWNMWRSMKVAKEDALAVATDMGAKVEQVHALVNAADTEKLARIDRLTTRVAQLEPTPSNIAESDAASEALRVKNVVNEAARTKSQFVEESMKALRAVK